MIALQVGNDLFRGHRLCRTVDKVRPISKQHAAGRRAAAGSKIHAEVARVRLDVVGARVHEHRDGLAATKPGIGEVKRERTLAAPRSAGEQVRSALANAAEPVVEQRDSAGCDTADGLGCPSSRRAR